MPLKRKHAIPAICVIVFFVLLVFVPNWKAIGVIMGVGFEEGSIEPLKLFSQTPRRERHVIESGSGRSLEIDVYTTPKSLAKKKGMIIYTPYIAGGLDDSQLQRIAQTFARVGFIVAVPSKKVDGPIISADDAEDNVAVALFLRNSQDYNVSDIGFMGLCFGNGPVFAAATDPRIADSVRFVLAFAPYFDLQNAIEFLKTGGYEYGEHKGSKDPAPYGIQLLDQSLQYFGSLDVPLKETFENAKFVFLQEKLSPASYVSDINFDVFILHSLDDGFIPYTESLRLADALADQTNVRLVLSKIFTHEEFRPVTVGNLYRYYVPEVLELYSFASEFLERHSP